MGATDYNLRFPFGPAESQVLSPIANTISSTCTNSLTMVSFDMDFDRNILWDLTPCDELLPVGSRMIVRQTSDGTGRNITFGTGFESPALIGVADKTFIVELIYDGVNFVHISSSQLD